MMLFRSPIKTFFALATVVSLLVSSSEAQSSQECVNETIMVQSDPNVASTIQEALNGTLTLQDPSTCTADGSTFTCSYDFATTSSNVESTCEAAEGQFVVYDLSVTCDLSLPNGTTYEVSADAMSAPSCIGTSCEPSQYVENYTTYVAEFLNNSTLLENCVAIVSSAPTIRGAKAFLVITGTLFASMFLF